jgi:hypothetical protein
VTIPPEVRGKFYTLRALAGALLAFAGAVFFLRPHEFGSRSLGLLAIFVSLWLVRRSNMYVWRARGQMVGAWSPATAAKRIGRLAWTLTAVSLVACGVFYFLMYLDLLHGGKETWPVYAFACAALALALTTGYVAMRIFQ